MASTAHSGTTGPASNRHPPADTICHHPPPNTSLSVPIHSSESSLNSNTGSNNYPVNRLKRCRSVMSTNLDHCESSHGKGKKRERNAHWDSQLLANAMTTSNASSERASTSSFQSTSVLSPSERFTIRQCVGLIDMIPEVKRGDKMYLFALRLFKENINREIFVSLPDTDTQYAWLLHEYLDFMGCPPPPAFWTQPPPPQPQ